MVQIQKDAKEQHEELMALLAAHPDLTSSDRSSVSHKIAVISLNSEFNILKHRFLELCPALMIGDLI
jgi:hypothetical protein